MLQWQSLRYICCNRCPFFHLVERRWHFAQSHMRRLLVETCKIPCIFQCGRWGQERVFKKHRQGRSTQFHCDQLRCYWLRRRFTCRENWADRGRKHEIGRRETRRTEIGSTEWKKQIRKYSARTRISWQRSKWLFRLGELRRFGKFGRRRRRRRR